MKLLSSLLLILSSLLLAGCESEPTVGMTEKQWLRSTVYSDSIYAEGNVTAYKVNRQFYYFRDGVLVKIGDQRIPADEIAGLGRSPQMSAPAVAAPVAPVAAAAAPVAAAAPADIYTELKKLDELRKSGIITEEEFQAQKKKILDRK